MKHGDIVVVVCKEQNCASIGVVGRIAYVAHILPTRYTVQYLSSNVGCAGVFYENEIRLAPAASRRKWTLSRVKKLFGECFEKGCSDDCPHFSDFVKVKCKS